MPTTYNDRFVTGLISITWREVLTQSLHDKYFSTPHTVYKINQLGGGAGRGRAGQERRRDNPDQRIASDASSVSECVKKPYYTMRNCYWNLNSFIANSLNLN